MTQVVGESADPGEPGVVARSRDGFALTAASGSNHGVVGESSGSPQGGKAGVFGSHRADGIGVAGESGAGVGVVGDSKDGQGVVGHSRTSHGVVGDTRSDPSRGHAGVLGAHLAGGMGVIGQSVGSGPGVVGTSDDGTGVIGECTSATGVGVLGRGGSTAGRFEGSVEITGGLVVAGSDLVARIVGLEGEIVALKARIANTSGPGASTATIDVELTHKPGPFSDLRVFGGGFDRGERVEITVESTTSTSSGGLSTQVDADASGAIDTTVAVTCSAGLQTTHTARARGVRSKRLSNAPAASC